MSFQPTSQTETPSGIAAARERFLTDDNISVGVRESISTSWRRSRAFNVHADRLELPFVREPNLESPLVSAARPIIRQLADDLSAEPVSIILTSSDGVVLSRATAHRPLGRMLDEVSLAPGYSYSEEHAGTNGIGTALENRQATLVRGSEHYASLLADLSCAGVPIVHPVSGAVMGALDLTGLADDGGPLLLSLAKSATAQIEQRMLSQASERESRLLNAYLATCRRAPQMMVLAIAGDVVLMNQRLRLAVDPQDQISLLEHAVDQTLDATASRRVSTLASGRAARLSPVPEYWDERSGMAVFHVHILDSGERPEPRTSTRRAGSGLPGVVGRSSSWQQCCDRVARHVGVGEWIAVAGETGTGRSTVLRAGATRARGSVRVFSAQDLRVPETLDALAVELDRDDFSVVLRDIDTLDGPTLAHVASMLQGRESAGWVGVTVGHVTVDALHDADAAAILLPFFSHTVPVPPLRHRIEDLHDLIPTLLRQLTRGRELTVSAEAMRQLSKYSWPGNVAQLRQILREIVTHQRSGVIDVHQLPPSCRSLSRHTLTRIEALERDAIVRSLEENGGSKATAAAALGISRATIYRKIKEFGIDV
ncbi:sigma-54-dependent Fis family transcriptional regulator [Gordonia sp. OPL2]|uniref:sigma-54-dependent Fis family transcriptional regulator n=1 Tax=Gordonia sp. OPL2 TaxID=2486274 RepID=UPI001655CAC6|nr:helix-turn-helix domain-containing protein [Gordonia sp. OPL2]ROZ99202.1 Fis family transcriptional regulator [Gordonia sp. OPL2]